MSDDAKSWYKVRSPGGLDVHSARGASARPEYGAQYAGAPALRLSPNLVSVGCGTACQASCLSAHLLLCISAQKSWGLYSAKNIYNGPKEAMEPVRRVLTPNQRIRLDISTCIHLRPLLYLSPDIENMFHIMESTQPRGRYDRSLYVPALPPARR